MTDTENAGGLDVREGDPELPPGTMAAGTGLTGTPERFAVAMKTPDFSRFMNPDEATAYALRLIAVAEQATYICALVRQLQSAGFDRPAIGAMVGRFTRAAVDPGGEVTAPLEFTPMVGRSRTDPEKVLPVVRIHYLGNLWADYSASELIGYAVTLLRMAATVCSDNTYVNIIESATGLEHDKAVHMVCIVPKFRDDEFAFDPATDEPLRPMDKVVGTGVTHHVPATYDRIPPFDGTHLWIATAAFRVKPDDPDGNGSRYLDHENLLTIAGVGCFHCEQGYRPGIPAECPGDPK